MRTREDFGPCELTERVRAALGRWCCPGGSPDGRRLVVAMAAMGNVGAADRESVRSVARRAGVHQNTAQAWIDEWMAIEARVREAADGELMAALHDVAVRLGGQAARRVADEMAEASPSAGVEHRPVVRLWGQASRVAMEAG